ncbi:hypothetical protein CFC21_085577 [Triticum aestivum]|uniref:Uncharacterized protein n=2 Tax=Triticum aestivum TaxID=4565 RepID=A0A3B6NXH5_WHEAT|nr:hypothetical protein CFC21_085577 [Triticum aestivum]
MAPAERSCTLGRFAAHEAAPPETLHIVRLQRLRLRQAAESCLDPIAEEEGKTSSPRAHGGSSSNATVDLAQSLS